MHDLKAIRQTPEKYDANWARRGLSPQTPEILKLDEERRALQTELQVLLQERNEKSKQIGQIKSQGGDADALMAEVAAIKEKTPALEEQEKAVSEQLDVLLASLPNQLDESVPEGKDESENVEVRKHLEPKLGNIETPDHQEIGEKLGMMDFETAAKISGSRFVILSHGLAKMERALVNFMLDVQTEENGYTQMSPPLLVRSEAMYGTGQLPKFGEDSYSTTPDMSQEIAEECKRLLFNLNKDFQNNNKPVLGRLTEYLDKADDLVKLAENEVNQAAKRWLIPTSEVPLTNIVAGEIVDEGTLPRRYTAFTPCFRSEAGSAGKDTRGMIRQHQFYKVEMVSIVKPEESEAEHERMTKCAEGILQKLELPYRTVVLCAGDTGFGAQKTYDIEVWLPEQKTYREISSCSNCGDFQARRMNARFKRAGEKDTTFLHTLNGSGLAIGRTLVAIMENYYDPDDGGVHVPEVLQSYMGGLKKIVPLSK